MTHEKHHHHAHQHETASSHPITRPLVLRILSIFALIFAPIMYIISLAFSLKTIYSPDYAISKIYNSTGDPTNITYTASPFYTCAMLTGTVDATTVDDVLATFNQSCSRTPFFGKGAMAACIANFKPGYDDTQICQKVVSSASLYVAGASLVGIALLFSLVYLVASATSAFAAVSRDPAYKVAATEDNDHHNMSASSGSKITTTYILVEFLGTLATLLAVLAVGCLILAQILGVQSLVNEQHPTAGESQSYPDVQGRWYMGRPALVFTSVAWLSALLGAFTAGTWCGVKGR